MTTPSARMRPWATDRRLRRCRASFLRPAGSAGQAPLRTQTNHALTSTSDHPMGADQVQLKEFEANTQ